MDYLLQKSFEFLWVAQFVEVCSGCVPSNCFHENGTAVAPISQEPEPEIGTLARSSEGPPNAANKREVQEDDRVRRTKPDFDSVIGSQVALDDPLILLNKLVLQLYPLIARRREKAWSPEEFVQLDNRKTCDLAQAYGESRLARRSWP